MIKKCLSFSMWLAIVAIAVPASAGLITVIHGLPALPGAVPSSNPVDISIDGTCEYTYRPYGSKIGPRELEPGLRTIIFYEALPDDPCNGTVLAARQGNIAESDQIDIVLGLNAEDQVDITTFDNTTALDALENGFQTAVEFRNVAAGPVLSAILLKGLESVAAGGVEPGLRFGPIETTAGEHTQRIENGPEVLEQDSDTLLAERAYWVYITGSVFKKTINLLSIESVPGELIEGQEPPPAAFSTCCAFGIAAQVSETQCRSWNGTYLGDVDPSKNPCQGIPWQPFTQDAPLQEIPLEKFTGF